MGFFGDLFGDSSDAYGDYGRQMREIAAKYDPWVNRGEDAANVLMGEQSKLIQNPNFLQDMISKGYQASPYQQMLTNDVTRQMNMNAANSGMIQSPLAQQALNDRINNMTGQFMNDYIGRGMNAYGMGMQGMGQTQGLGFDALNQRSNLLGQGAGADLQGAMSKQGMWSNLLGTGLTGALAFGTGGASLGLPNWGQGFGSGASFRDTSGLWQDF